MLRIASFETREWTDPYKDRRPMTDDWCLITVNDEGHKYVTMSKYEEKYGWFVDPDLEVIAWMPLPEPARNEELLQDVETYVREHYDGKEEETVSR